MALLAPAGVALAACEALLPPAAVFDFINTREAVPTRYIRSLAPIGPSLCCAEPSVPTQPRIRTVARALMPNGTLPQKDYGVIGYLLFPNRLSTNRIQRHAAATAFICLFASVQAVEAASYFDPPEMAVFFAPVEAGEEAERAARERDVERFLETYDYFTAGLIAKEAGLDLAGVYLVGFVPRPDHRPLEDGPRWIYPIQEEGLASSSAPLGLLRLDLSTKSPKQIEAALLALNNEFRLAGWETESADDFQPLTVVRRVFDSLGRLLQIGPSVAAEEPGCP